MKLIFLSKKHEVNDTYSFIFKPVGPVTWQAGQSIRLEIDGHERRFSIVSAPFEKNIAITTRLSGSGFKKALDSLGAGDMIDGYNIEGTFVWNEKISHKFLIAGGIGITAFLPMLEQLHYENKTINAWLVYTNHTDYFLFKQELKHLQETHPELKFDFQSHSRFSMETIEKYKREILQSQIYVSGPEAMVRHVSQILLGVGVDEKMIKCDLFTGFDTKHY